MEPVFYPPLQDRLPHDPSGSGGRSLSGYMMLLIAAIMLPMLALVALLAVDYGSAARRTIEAQRLDVASNIKILIDREIDQTAGFLDGISNAPRLRGDSTEFIEKVTAVASAATIRFPSMTSRAGRRSRRRTRVRPSRPRASVLPR